VTIAKMQATAIYLSRASVSRRRAFNGWAMMRVGQYKRLECDQQPRTVDASQPIYEEQPLISSGCTCDYITTAALKDAL